MGRLVEVATFHEWRLVQRKYVAERAAFLEQKPSRIALAIVRRVFIRPQNVRVLLLCFLAIFMRCFRTSRHVDSL